MDDLIYRFSRLSLAEAASTHILDIMKTIYVKNNVNIKLLHNIKVVKWLFNDLWFSTKDNEDAWGRRVMKLARPDLKMDKQWTNLFGEIICKELFILCNKTIFKPLKIDGLQPDLETDKYIIEVKTQTFFTSGTAGEKILGVPYKYAEVPTLYKKNLLIICFGGAELVCKKSYGVLENTSKNKLKILKFYKKIGIFYIGATSLLLKLR